MLCVWIQRTSGKQAKKKGHFHFPDLVAILIQFGLQQEMALYVLPRALYSVMNDLIPSVLSRGETGEFFTRWIERLIFSLSTGVVTTAVSLPSWLLSCCSEGLLS